MLLHLSPSSLSVTINFFPRSVGPLSQLTDNLPRSSSMPRYPQQLLAPLAAGAHIQQTLTAFWSPILNPWLHCPKGYLKRCAT